MRDRLIFLQAGKRVVLIALDPLWADPMFHDLVHFFIGTEYGENGLLLLFFALFF